MKDRKCQRIKRNLSICSFLPNRRGKWKLNDDKDERNLMDPETKEKMDNLNHRRLFIAIKETEKFQKDFLEHQSLSSINANEQIREPRCSKKTEKHISTTLASLSISEATPLKCHIKCHLKQT